MTPEESRGPVRLLRRLTLLWAVAVVPLLMWFDCVEMFEHPKQLAVKLAAALVALSVALEKNRANRPAAVPATLRVIVPAILVAALVSTVLSPLPGTALFGEYASYQGWLHWLALAVLLASLAAGVRTPGEAGRFLGAIALSLTAVSVYALMQPLGLDPVSWSLHGPVVRAFSTAGNPLYLGFLLAAGFPCILGLAWSRGGRPGLFRVLVIGASGVVAAGVLASGSRSALAGMLAGGAVFLWLMRKSAVSRGTVRNIVMVCLFATLLAPALLPADRNPFPLLATRMLEFAGGRDSRPLIWAGAGRLVRNAPLFGSGLDTFASLHHSVRTPALWDHLWRGSPEKAHNELIQYAVTVGLVGTGFILWLLVAVVRTALAEAAGNHCRAAAAAGLAALAVPSMFGFLTCGSQIVGVLLASVLLAAGRMSPGPRWLSGAAAAVLVVSLLVHLRLAVVDVALKSSLSLDGRGISRAIELDSSPWAQRLLQTGFALEQKWFGQTIAPGSGPVQASARLATLEGVYHAALRANPLLPVAHSNLARLAMRAGRMEEALAGYDRARAMNPTDAYLALEHAQALAAAGSDSRALDTLAGLESLYPGFAEAPGLAGYLHLSAGNRAAAEAALARSLELNWHGNYAAAYAAAGNLAKIYHESGRESAARMAMLKAQQFAASARPR